MKAEAAVTLLAAVLIVAVLAVHLVRIALVLKRISATLDIVIGAVVQIPSKLEPAPPILLAINRDLGAAQRLLQGLLAKKPGRAS